MSCLRDLGASCRNMDQEKEWDGVEQEAHSPHTMGEAAKGPAGVAGFLKEKSQNELLRGRLASDIPIPSIQTFQGQWVGGWGEVGQRLKVANCPHRECLHSSLPVSPPSGRSAWLWGGAGEEGERGQQGCGS